MYAGLWKKNGFGDSREISRQISRFQHFVDKPNPGYVLGFFCCVLFQMLNCKNYLHMHQYYLYYASILVACLLLILYLFLMIFFLVVVVVVIVLQLWGEHYYIIIFLILHNLVFKWCCLSYSSLLYFFPRLYLMVKAWKEILWADKGVESNCEQIKVWKVILCNITQVWYQHDIQTM